MSSPSPAPALAAPSSSHPPVGTVVPVLALAGVAVSLMQTLVIPIVGQLPTLLHTSAENATWGITATLLAAAVATPIAGRLGDMLGKRPLLLASLVMLVVGSAVCAVSASLPTFVVGRVLQGFASGVIPLGISLMRDVLPREKLGPATSVMSASLGVGGALGLPLAAVIAQAWNWHVLFWVSAALGVVVIALVATLIPASDVRAGGRLDLVGAAGLSVALVAVLVAVSKGEGWGWGSGRTIGLLVGGVVVAIVWGWFELRTSQPLVDLRTTARPQVLLTNVSSVMFGFAIFAMSLSLPQIIQLPESTGFGLGESMLVAGLTMVPSGLMMMVSAPISGTIARTRGPRTTLMIGALVVAVGYALAVFFMGSIWELAVVAGVIGVGIGFGYGSMPALIMAAVPVSETASANSVNTLVRSVGTSVSSAVAGVVLAASATTVGALSAPSQNGFRIVLVAASGAALLALLVAAFIPKAPRTDAAGPTPSDAADAVDEADRPRRLDADAETVTA